MTDAIKTVFEWMNDLIISTAGNSDLFTLSLSSVQVDLYQFSLTVMTTVMKPIAYTILSLFFILELYKLSVKNDGASASGMGAEIVFKLLFRVVLFKYVVDSAEIIMNAIFDVSGYMAEQLQGVSLGGSEPVGAIDLVLVETFAGNLGFWMQLVVLILAILLWLVVLVSVMLAQIIVTTRLIQLYVYFAIAPIPLATLPHEEMSQIGKGFLKSFAAVSLQGVLINIVLLFFPVLSNSIFQSTSQTILEIMGGLLCYSIVLALAVLNTSKWSKAICNSYL